MSSAIEILWKQASKTFSGRRSVGYKFCQKNFDKLRNLMNEIKAEDVKIDGNVLRHVENETAPMCVMDIFEDEDLTITVFLLKHGVTMPMHDHPGMHGLLKVISGTVKINSYTVRAGEYWLVQPEEGFKDEEEIRSFIAVKHPAVTVRATDPACVLTPEDKNFHEITCVEGPGVFLDILSPPYVTHSCYSNAALRPCTYFTEIGYEKCAESKETPCEVRLIAMTKPPELYSRPIIYKGPTLRS